MARRPVSIALVLLATALVARPLEATASHKEELVASLRAIGQRLGDAELRRSIPAEDHRAARDVIATVLRAVRNGAKVPGRKRSVSDLLALLYHVLETRHITVQAIEPIADEVARPVGIEVVVPGEPLHDTSADEAFRTGGVVLQISREPERVRPEGQQPRGFGRSAKRRICVISARTKPRRCQPTVTRLAVEQRHPDRDARRDAHVTLRFETRTHEGACSLR